MTMTTDLATCTLDITGMTCASCVRRVEKALGKVPGVSAAQVNLATEAATVTYDPAGVTAAELTAAVGVAGYTGLLRPGVEPPAGTALSAPPRQTAGSGGRHDGELARLKRKWQVALASGLGLMVLMYLPLDLDAMDWLMPAILVLATVVQFWAGRDIYAAAWAAARHRATNMNTLVALGTGISYGYSASPSSRLRSPLVPAPTWAASSSTGTASAGPPPPRSRSPPAASTCSPGSASTATTCTTSCPAC